jgi:cobalt/nickel transport system ATP-binding protein
MDNPIFELKNVHFSYLGRFPALRAIDMSIAREEKIAVLGANGSGKSTLLHILDGLIFTDKGSVSAFGRILSQEAFADADFSQKFRKSVGLVFQNPDVQLFCPTVKEDIVFGPLQLGIDKKETQKRLEKIVELFNIQDLIDRSPHQLSVGEKRKVAIASTLIIDPEAILLDEPTAGLDPKTVRQIVDIINGEDFACKTIITATHDLHIVEEISDTVYVLDSDKKIARSGPTKGLLHDREFLKTHNLVHIHSHRHKDKVHVHHHEHLDHHL